MDPFNKLPSELRVQILISLRSRRSVLRLAQASPAMLHQYLMSKAYIARMLVALDFDDDTIQDAMGIILLPSPDNRGHYSKILRRHYARWLENRLPNPLETRDGSLIDEVHRLQARQLLFIEDYLTKATAIFPPRDTGLLYPDTLYVNACAYASDMGLKSVEALHPIPVEAAGFDVATVLEDEFSAIRPLAPSVTAGLSLHSDIYRQRAWAFFDNNRFYPSSGTAPHFPDLIDMGERWGSTENDVEWFSDPKHVRARHRSQKWHDELPGKSCGNEEVKEFQDTEVETVLPATSERYWFRRLPRFWR
ncbi:hypothetical protein NCS55_01174100 [Fusarium keratoplasticum]|nr:hypothetical protein NCS55_01174100 [Fusarium keratoplasticum]